MFHKNKCPAVNQDPSTPTDKLQYTAGHLFMRSPLSAERAARQRIAACKRGKAEVVLSLQAQIATKFHGLFPGLTANLLSFVNRFLPLGKVLTKQDSLQTSIRVGVERSKNKAVLFCQGKTEPKPGGIGTQGALGKDSTSSISPSALTAWNDSAAQRNNQFAVGVRLCKILSLCFRVTSRCREIFVRQAKDFTGFDEAAAELNPSPEGVDQTPEAK